MTYAAPAGQHTALPVLFFPVAQCPGKINVRLPDVRQVGLAGTGADLNSMVKTSLLDFFFNSLRGFSFERKNSIVVGNTHVGSASFHNCKNSPNQLIPNRIYDTELMLPFSYFSFKIVSHFIIKPCCIPSTIIQ